MDIVQNVLFLLAGLGVFIFGMNLMSQGLEQSAGKGMQKLLAKISNNRFAGLGIGAAVTAIIQSSSATSVMAIGFVNAGIMTLHQATGILMGAKIGTTITGVLVGLKGVFGIVSYIFMALACVGVFLPMITKSDKVKRFSTILVGVGLIFIALEIMGMAVQTEAIEKAFASMFSAVDFPLLLVVFGIVATAVLQSSSVVTGIIIMLVQSDVVDPGLALFLVLGANIGTCISAVLASIGATPNAKRTAFIMVFISTIGVVLALPFVWIFKEEIVGFLNLISGNNQQMAVAFFHVIYNVVTVIAMIGFVKPIVALSEKLIKEKKKEEIPDKLYFLDKRILQTPHIAIAQTMKEVRNMAQFAEDNFDRSIQFLIDPSKNLEGEIEKAEREINYLDKAITNYLIKISTLNITDEDEVLIGSLYHVVSDIERIGDHAENFSEVALEMYGENIRFSEDAKSELLNMYNHVKKLYRDVMYCFINRTDALFDQINETEEAIDRMQQQYEKNHVQRLKAGECTVETGAYFNTITSNLERIADHLTNIAYSVRPKND